MRSRLSAKSVASLKAPGRYADGGGLYLLIRDRGSTLERLWLYIYSRGERGKNKRFTISLGRAADIGLAEARDKAACCRAALDKGLDPKLALAKATGAVTFGAVADELIDDILKGFKNEKHKAQWQTTLSDDYCRAIRDRPIDAIATADVLAVLKPMWLSKPETAKRIRGRIERVLDAAKAAGLRSGDNPARWRGHLSLLLPLQPKLTRGHHKALAWREAPAFMVRLRGLQSMSAIALEWTILTASRTQETVYAKRSEIAGSVWTIPAERMKSKREHRVPLTDRCLEIVAEVSQIPSEWLFPGLDPADPLSTAAMAECLKGIAPGITVHGFRSTFRDWVGDATSFPERIAEAALAHVLGDKTEAAYRRGDALDRRRSLMEAWGRYLDDGRSVVQIASAR